MSEPGDRMETTDLTHTPGPEDPKGSTDPSAEIAPVSVRFDREPRQVEETAEDVVFDVRDLAVSYAGVVAVHKVTLPIYRNEITALIGPSGCGKTTFIRCLNRMNDLIETARVEGTLLYHGVDLYDPSVDPVEVRRRIGMVFQKPNPFPKSIYDNIAFGPKIAGLQGQHGRARRGVAPARGAVGRGQGQAEGVRASRSRAGSSSACASRGRSPRGRT